MFTFERTSDLSLIRSIIVSDKRLYEGMADDTCPAMEDFQLPEDPAVWYVLVREEGAILGFWALIPKSEDCAEVHTCLRPCAWGYKARAAAREMAQWIWVNTPFSRLTTMVPSYNRTALMFAKVSGMKENGLQREHYLKNGKLHDLIHLAMLKPEAI